MRRLLEGAFISKIKNEEKILHEELTNGNRNVLIYPEISKILLKENKLNCSETSQVDLSQQNMTFSCLSLNKRLLFE